MDVPRSRPLHTDSTDGLPDSHSVDLGTHAHANWGFTAEGVYQLTMTVTATLASGETQTDTDTYTVAVGDVDPSTALGGGIGGVAYLVSFGVLLLAGGTALLVLYRRRTKKPA